MIIDKKKLTTLQQLKIKYSIDEFPVESNYLYIDCYKALFICKSRNNLYNVCASPVCKLSFIDSQSMFNVIYKTNVLEDAISFWKRSIKEII